MKKKILAVAALLVIIVITSLASGFLGVYVGSRYFAEDKPTNSANQTNQPVLNSNDDTFTNVVDQTKDAVVSVIITKDLPVYESYNPFDSNGFLDLSPKPRKQIGEEEKQVGAGSGFIVSEDGYIVTNRHVVYDPDANYTVVLNNGEKIEAKVIAKDEILDIAIIKIDKTGLKFIEMGDSDSLKVGQHVLAIGNTLGEFSNTVTSGIVSGLLRSIVAGGVGTGESEALSDLIQTDASISPGNSGGPLVNLKGEAIGVNVAVSQQGENVGFAIPINQIKSIVKSVRETGKIIRPYLGIRYRQIDKALKEKNNLKYEYGAIVLRGRSDDELAVVPGSPADKSGIRENDIILEINGVKLDEKTSLQREIQKYQIGEEVDLKIFSKDEEKNVKVKLEALEK